MAARHLSYLFPLKTFQVVILRAYLDTHSQALLESLYYFPNVQAYTLSNESAASALSPDSDYQLILDGIFGFSFKGPIKPKFATVFGFLKSAKAPIVSIDVPSGWEVESGNVNDTFVPAANISLGSIKHCMKGYAGVHYFAGHFMPASLLAEFGVTNPVYADRARLFTLVDTSCAQGETPQPKI